MKYIKKFESKSKINGIFYFIPYIDEHLAKMAIKKLDISDSLKSTILNYAELFDNLGSDAVVKYNKGFFIGILNKQTKKDIMVGRSPWSFCCCTRLYNKKKGYISYLSVDDYSYGGEIKLDDIEIDADKYNL